MRKRHHGLTAVAGLAALVLAGCGGGTATQTSPASTHAAAATSASAATITRPVPPAPSASATAAADIYAVDVNNHNDGNYYLETSDVNVLYDVSKLAEGNGSVWRAYRALPTDPWAAKAQVVCTHSVTSTTPRGTSVTADVKVLNDDSPGSAGFALQFCKDQGWK